LVAALVAVTLAAARDGAWSAAVVLGLAGFALGYRMILECGSATTAVLGTIDELPSPQMVRMAAALPDRDRARSELSTESL
jgi:hypothetical protein